MIEEGPAIDYRALQRGTPVYGSDDVEVGKVDAVLDNYEERIFDGIVLEDRQGGLRFVDAPEVLRTAERAVILTIDSEQAEQLPPPEKAPPRYQPNLKTGRISRLFGSGWKRR